VAIELLHFEVSTRTSALIYSSLFHPLASKGGGFHSPRATYLKAGDLMESALLFEGMGEFSSADASH